MKTQLSKPARHRARYTEEYKKEALELWRNSGRSAAKVAAELGIEPHCSTVGHVPSVRSRFPRLSVVLGRSVEELEAEIRRLRAENTKLLEQREVLKKSLGHPLRSAGREICPDRADERLIQDRTVVRGTSWSRAAVIMIGKRVGANPGRGSWQTFGCVNASGRSSPAVARPTGVHDWLKLSDAQDDATA